MKPDAATLFEQCPDVDPALVEAHLGRLDESYFERFDTDQVAEHLRRLARLSREHPVEVILQVQEDRSAECTVLAFDYPAEFSLITGVLAGLGFGVVSGDVFTYERRTAQRPENQRSGPRRARNDAHDPLHRRRIIDRFAGHVYTDLPLPEWEQALRQRLEEVIALLEKGDADSVSRAKQRVNELVTQRLAKLHDAGLPVLYPVNISISNDRPALTIVKVVSQDTPAFLYALSTALSLHRLSIEHVRIRTVNKRIEDEVGVVDGAGLPVTDERLIDKIKLSILLTKQFTYFLDKAPDPYTALSRFDHLVTDMVNLPESSEWLKRLSEPRAMQDLARLLGASDHLWEDFIRLQYETLLPIVTSEAQQQAEPDAEAPVAERLAASLRQGKTFEEMRERLNDFKDNAIFRADLDYILNPDVSFRHFAERLTDLAEAVVDTAAELIYQQLVERYGHPRTVAGLEATYVILGLGKLGGAALGYASDIELLFVFSDSGETDGKESIANGEFFSRLVDEIPRVIQAKREGIFRVDLRLRPHGNSGPKACSLESFCGYYGPGGPAHSYERLALVRLRAVGGDRDLGQRLVRLRDDFIYASPSIVVAELRDLRMKQFEEKNRPGEYNAKFSPGALVDLEYAVQILQVMHAKSVPALRTPRIHEALEGLERARVLSPEEAHRLNKAYNFLRKLINGLRMLRGSAQDLFLPPPNSPEYIHLARRMGYTGLGELDAGRELHVEFQTRTAGVRAFVERHFGRSSLPGPAVGNVADLVLSDHPPPELRSEILAEYGFADSERAFRNLRSLAGEGLRRDAFAKLAVLACDILRREPHPGMALNNWERFIRSLTDPEAHFERLLGQPKRLEILLAIFSRSQFLANTLIRHPEFWPWVTTPENLHQPLWRAELAEALLAQGREVSSHEEWLDVVRCFRQRQMLRIGTRDMYLHAETTSVIRDLSTLADAVIQSVLGHVWAQLREEVKDLPAELPNRFCLLAFGKLGGNELNYSSDIDLLAIHDGPPNDATRTEIYARVMEYLHHDLSRHTVEGHAYRVDLRLRPYGASGAVVSSMDELESYYQAKAAPWEIQALLKLRPVAGNLRIGRDLKERLQPILLARRDAAEIAHSIEEMRAKSIKNRFGKLDEELNVKIGRGGIRDVEFLVQGLQLMTAARGHPELLAGNTLDAIRLLDDAGVLDANRARTLAADYIFLRRVEHHLQILEDRQSHALPSQPAERQALARRMLGPEATDDQFMDVLEACFDRVRDAYTTYLSAPPA